MKRIAFFVSTITTLGCGLAAAIVACGGSTEDAAVAPAADSGGGSSTSTSSGATSTSSGGSTTSSGGSTSGSGGPADGGTTDGSANTDGGASGSTPNQIKCGAATCNTATQKCCTTFTQQGGAVATCIGTNDNCQGADQECDDKADCPANQICCAGGGGGGGGSFGATCQASCGQGIQLCKAANECVDGGTCQTYTCFNQQVSLCRKPQFGCQ